ncbi:MAG: molybdenum cofactor guanylyltransferase [Anaerolineaceae bacterium]|nr:molybdenum cofactor guanylyltransferase [Anaerolineaceae bacterium]
MKLSVVIQAGGESRRMGKNKELVSFLGKPLIQRVIERVNPIADELLITSNQPETLAFLQIAAYQDVLQVNGALSGLYTALAMAQNPLVAVVACDMAFVSAPLLIAEKEILINQNADGVVPETDTGFEPFHAVYRREICLAAVKSALAAGMKRADGWFSAVQMVYFPRNLLPLYDPSGQAFTNINTPEELTQAESYARMIGQSPD